jgi:hypothetical protein
MEALVDQGAQSNILPYWMQEENRRRGAAPVTIGGHIFTGAAQGAAPVPAEAPDEGLLASLLGTTDEALTGMGEAAYAMSQPKAPQWLERPQAAPYQPQRRDPMAAYRQLFQRLRA